MNHFAQNSLKPEEVIVEWEASQSALGGTMKQSVSWLRL